MKEAWLIETSSSKTNLGLIRYTSATTAWFGMTARRPVLFLTRTGIVDEIQGHCWVRSQSDGHRCKYSFSVLVLDRFFQLNLFLLSGVVGFLRNRSWMYADTRESCEANPFPL